AELASEMIGRVCESGAADASVQAGSRAAGSRDVALAGTVACRDGAASKGTAACEEMRDLLDAELGTAFTTATDFGGGCSVTAY
ncbi:MAG: hypothetical protein H6742_22340, partial [Alphaproteobacteria bacterium]|nr:hypothetical protein [Alphaproteobacteria bacterium]